MPSPGPDYSSRLSRLSPLCLRSPLFLYSKEKELARRPWKPSTKLNPFLRHAHPFFSSSSLWRTTTASTNTDEENRHCSPLKKTEIQQPVPIYCIHRRHHIDRPTANGTVLRTPPTCHLGGGACTLRAATFGFPRVFCAGLVDRGLWGADRGRNKPTSSLLVARAADAPPFLWRPDVYMFRKPLFY